MKSTHIAGYFAHQLSLPSSHTSDDCYICLQNRPGHARQSGNRSCCCSRVTLLALQIVEESDEEYFRTTATLMFIFWPTWLDTWLFASAFSFFKLCCLLHGGSLIRVFPHAVWNVFNLFIYCWYIMSILAYWCSLVIVVCTRYWRHSVTIGCCMFCFITFKYVFIFKRWQWREINIFLWWLWFLNCILVFWPIEWRFIEQVLMAPFFSLFTADVLC